MKWIKIDKDNLPSGDVLAGNFNVGSDCYKNKLYGTLSVDERGSVYCFCANYRNCECEYDLTDATHYIDIDKFDSEVDGLEPIYDKDILRIVGYKKIQ